MAESTEFNLDDLSAEQRANLSANLNRIRLNESQAILQTPYSGERPYNYKKPEGFGGTLKNIGANLLRPGMESLGLRPSIEGQIANMRYDGMRRDIAGEQAERSRDQMLRESLIASGAPRSTVKGLYGKGLQDFSIKFQGQETKRGDGSSYTVNPLTNVQTTILDPSPERKEYNRYTNSLRAPNILLTPQEYRAQGEGLNRGAIEQASEDVVSNNYYQKLIRERTGAYTTSIYNAGVSASNALPNLYNLESIIASNKTDQGYFAPPRMVVRDALTDLGFSFEGDQANEAMFKVLSNKLAIAGRTTADGGGMPGSMSDSDRSFLVEMVPRLGNSPEANALIVQAMVLMEERKIDMRQEQDAYYKKKKTFDGIEDHLFETFRGSNMFDQMTKEAEAMLRPKGGSGVTVR